MKTKFILLLTLFATLESWAQKINSPTYSRRDDISIRIDEIERASGYTIVKGTYENVHAAGWACINSATYLKDCKVVDDTRLSKVKGFP